jgi:hypothetical protein
MPILHLGVNDVPYTHTPSSKGRNSSVTTGDVAGWLEDKYHIMEIFAQQHQQDMADDLAHGMAGALESAMMGAPTSLDPFGAGVSRIEERMKDFITNREMDALGYPGVPTQAAKDRAAGKKRSSRMVRARTTNAAAISFYDSGLYQSNMRAWVE